MELSSIVGIIPSMRRFFSLIMVVLLALRGLAGDAMAMENPAAHASMATAMVHTVDMDADAGAHHGHQPSMQTAQGDTHSGHTSVAATCSNEASAHGEGCGSHEGQCTTCGLCHTVLGQALYGSTPAPLARTSQPMHKAAHFVSATAAQLVKPPIPAL
ncbi:MAG: hypothetical protein RSF42_12145 [Comamonas sp.]